MVYLGHTSSQSGIIEYETAVSEVERSSLEKTSKTCIGNSR